LSRFKAWVQDLQHSGLRLLIAYILLGLVIFALQLPAIPGIFLMALAAPLWIGLLVHVAMAHFAWLAIRRMISRAWLALPLGFYAGGYALHLASVHAAKAEAAAINARNAAVRLTVDQPFRYLRDGNADSFALIEHYRLDRSFLRQADGTITTTYYARGADCDNALQGYYYQRRHEPWAFRKDIFYHFVGNKTRQCILSHDGLPAEWRYRIAANYTYAEDRASSFFTRRGKAFEIFDERDKHTLGIIEIATFVPFPVIPWIVAGCGLNSGAAKWQCGWGLTKGGTSIAAGYKPRAADDPQKNPFIPSLDAETWEVTQLAKALGLEPRQPTD
jgi:hypothetical protein